MKLEDVTELTKVNGQTQAQRLLDAGWRILAVCVKQDSTDQYAEYHLGRVAPEAPAKPFNVGSGAVQVGVRDPRDD